MTSAHMLLVYFPGHGTKTYLEAHGFVHLISQLEALILEMWKC